MYASEKISLVNHVHVRQYLINWTEQVINRYFLRCNVANGTCKVIFTNPTAASQGSWRRAGEKYAFALTFSFDMY